MNWYEQVNRKVKKLDAAKDPVEHLSLERIQGRNGLSQYSNVDKTEYPLWNGDCYQGNHFLP